MRPAQFVVCWAVFAQLISMKEVCALTNAEVFDLIKDYVTDVEVLDSDNNGISDYLQDDSDAVIDLPGGPDDEIDLQYIAVKLGLLNNYNNVEDIDYETDDTDTDDDLQDDIDEDNHLPDGPDDNQDVEHVADVQDVEGQGNETDVFGDYLHDGTGDLVYLKRGTDYELDAEYIKNQRGLISNNEACVNVADLRNGNNFEVTFSVNDHDLFHKEISLENPPLMCFRVPGMRTFGEVCVEFYDVDMETKHACARLTGVLDLKIKEYSVDLKLGCFTIPREQALTNLRNDGDFQPACAQESWAGEKAVDLHDMFHQLQDGQGDQDTDNNSIP